MPMVSALRAVLFYSTGVSAVRHIAILAFFIDDYLFGSISRNVAGTTRRRINRSLFCFQVRTRNVTGTA